MKTPETIESETDSPALAVGCSDLLADCIKHGIKLPNPIANVITDNNKRWGISHRRHIGSANSLVSLTEAEVLRVRGLGRQKLAMLKKCLSEAGLRLYMDVISKDDAMRKIEKLRNEADTLQKRINETDGDFIIS